MRRRAKISTMAVAFLLFLSVSSSSLATDVLPGVDLFTSPPDSNNNFAFGLAVGCPSLPPDFFGPGSDPFDGLIVFEGLPLETSPPEALGSADAIVERTTTANLPACGSTDEVSIQLVALSLVSISPITVTYGGPDPELWDVRMCLSSIAAQPPGSMLIAQECESGGTFTATLPVIPKFIFTRIDPPGGQRFLDWSDLGSPLLYLTQTGHWLYSDPGFDVMTSPGGILVDHDCGGTIDVPVGAGSNFYSGLYCTPCNCIEPPTSYDILMTYWYSDCGMFGWLPASGPSEYDVLPGVHLCYSPPDSNTSIRFGGPDCPLIPADFFAPYSDPFEGLVVLEGQPVNTNVEGVLGNANAVIERLETASLPSCPSSDVIDIEIIALDLVSISPITVSYDYGMWFEDWEVRVCLSSLEPQVTGSMEIFLECDSGGTFTADLPVIPKIIFTKVSEPATQVIWDWGDAYPPVVLQTQVGHWLYSDPGFDLAASPGGIYVDATCENIYDVLVGPSTNFYANIYGTPCDCFNPPTSFDLWMTYWYADCATLGCLPASEPVSVLPGVHMCYSPPDSNTSIRFGGVDCNAIPADFFAPGSDPFDGLIVLEGVPVETEPDGILGESNAIVERLEAATFPSCPSSDNVPIVIRALNLVGISPITVTYNGGMDPEPWEVRMCLSSVDPQPPGWMEIILECDSGGTFSAQHDIIPKFIFTKILDPATQVIWDWGGPYPEIVTLETVTGHWLFSDPGFNIVTCPGEVLADHDCDGVEDIPIGPSTNFFPNVFGEPCDCSNPPTSFFELMTYWYGECATLGCLPPAGLGYAYLPGDANMINGAWPPSVLGADVTYLVGYFRGGRPRCLLDGFWCSADANGDCNVIGSDVTFLINYLRGGAWPTFCPAYPPLYPPIPPVQPPGWPNCEP